MILTTHRKVSAPPDGGRVLFLDDGTGWVEAQEVAGFTPSIGGAYATYTDAAIEDTAKQFLINDPVYSIIPYVADGYDFRGDLLTPQVGNEWGADYYAMSGSVFIDSTASGGTMAWVEPAVRTLSSKYDSGVSVSYVRSSGFRVLVRHSGGVEILYNQPAAFDVTHTFRLETEIIGGDVRVAAKLDGNVIVAPINFTLPGGDPILTSEAVGYYMRANESYSSLARFTAPIQIDTFREML